MLEDHLVYSGDVIDGVESGFWRSSCAALYFRPLPTTTLKDVFKVLSRRYPAYLHGAGVAVSPFLLEENHPLCTEALEEGSRSKLIREKVGDKVFFALILKPSRKYWDLDDRYYRASFAGSYSKVVKEVTELSGLAGSMSEARLGSLSFPSKVSVGVFGGQRHPKATKNFFLSRGWKICGFHNPVHANTCAFLWKVRENDAPRVDAERP